MASQTAIGSTKIPIKLAFGTVGVGNAPGTLYTNVTSVTEFRMPYKGSVIGYSVNLTGTLTTGTLQFTPTKNGTPMTGTFSNGTVNIGTLGNHERVQANQPTWSFVEGDTVGLCFGKTGTIAPTTRDCVAVLFVLLDGYDY